MDFIDISQDDNGNADCLSLICRNFVHSGGAAVAAATYICRYPTGLVVREELLSGQFELGGQAHGYATDAVGIEREHNKCTFLYLAGT